MTALGVHHAVNPTTKNLEVPGFDSVGVLFLRGGIPRSTGDLPRNSDSEILSPRILGMWTGRRTARDGASR